MITDKEVEAAKLALLNHSGIITTKTVREALIAARIARSAEENSEIPIHPDGKHLRLVQTTGPDLIGSQSVPSERTS